MEAGSLLGTGAIMVLDETDCMVEAARRLVEFYAHESCGKCTPCREGTWWATRVLGRIEGGYGREEDLPVMADVGENILFRAFCALADGAVSPIQSTLKYFMDEYEAHIRDGRCPVTGKGPGHDAERPSRESEQACGHVAPTTGSVRAIRVRGAARWRALAPGTDRDARRSTARKSPCRRAR